MHTGLEISDRPDIPDMPLLIKNADSIKDYVSLTIFTLLAPEK